VVLLTVRRLTPDVFLDDSGVAKGLQTGILSAKFPKKGYNGVAKRDRFYMRKLLSLAALSLLVPGLAGQGSTAISELPEGTVSQNAYANEALGITWQFPGGWTASTDPSETEVLDPEHPKGRARQCSRVLVWLRAPQISADRFSSMAALIAIDPTCLSHAEFPKRLPDARHDVDAVVDAIIKNFKRSPFFSPYGVKIVAFPSPDSERVTIDFTGGMTINAISGNPAPKKEPLEVTTSFSVTERRSYWMAIACVADASSNDELKKAKPAFVDVAK
jgi:hypothetical protein